MQAILSKLYTWGKFRAYEDILTQYQQDDFAIINFIYFANIVAHQLFLEKDKTEKQREYKKILLKSDFLLPDWIALQFFYWTARLFSRIGGKTYRLENLNGTDFVPFFLESLKKQYGSQKLCILLYGSKEEYAKKVEEKLKFQGYNVIYTQEGYSDFDREEAETQLNEYQDTINILLIARSTPKIPLQELRVSRNYQKIQQNKLLVFTTGGLFDFIAEAQKRAPKPIRILKLEWLWRLISDPKRNIQKVLNTLMLFPYLIKYAVLGKK